MKFSIITSVYNNISTVKEALDSVSEQRNVEIEHIIMDGGSNDGSIETVMNFELRVLNENKKFNSPLANQKFVLSNSERSKLTFKFISEKDEGIYDALNKGIAMASGDIIGILHADDLFADKDILEKISKVFEDEKTDGVYSDLVYVKKNDLNKTIRFWKASDYKKLLFGWMPPHPTLFLRRSIFEKIGLYDLQFKIASDYDFILRLFKENKFKIKYLPIISVKMRIGGNSNKNFKKILQKSIEDYKALRKNKIDFPLFVLVCKNFRKLTQFF